MANGIGATGVKQSKTLRLVNVNGEVGDPCEMEWQYDSTTSMAAGGSGEEAWQLEVRSLAPGKALLRTSKRQYTVWWAQTHEHIWIWLSGMIYTFMKVSKQPSRAGGVADTLQSGHLLAPMPGTVLQCNIVTGQQVEKGQALVVMESMKMELTLSAPMDATVKTLHCQPGQLVDMKALLVELEAAE